MLIHPMVERLRGLGLSAMADAFIDMRNQSAADDLSRPKSPDRGNRYPSRLFLLIA
jgi:hypothetical protein